MARRDEAPKTIKIEDGAASGTLVDVRKVFLRVVEGPDADAQVELVDAVVIGRGDGCGLALTDGSVSTEHARVELRPDGIWVHDLGKTVLAVEEAAQKLLVLPEEATVLGGMVGGSEAMRLLFGVIRRIARTHLTVLVQGETGTGKELVARTLHDLSSRARGPFVVVDGAGLSESLAGSELFGHEKGAFTGADGRHRGAFERARGGTLFLDEVGELSPEVQAQLLRVLETRTFQRLGGEEQLPADVRVVVATHRDLAAMVAAGGFRRDLYYRLNEVNLTAPPLRERLEDLPLLVERLVEGLKERVDVGGPIRFTEEALRAMAGHAWPGNVRELRNYVGRILALGLGPVVDRADLPPFDDAAPGAMGPASSAKTIEGAPPAGGKPTLAAVKDMERELIVETLARCGGNKAKAARELGIPVTTLKYRLRRYGL